jgi:alpha-amylase
MITLVLAFHNHQPVGNFGWVFEEAYQKAYRPLMEVLAEFPSIRFGQHYTGILLDWFRQNHPEFIETIRMAVDAGRIELISGGYYEPIMAMLPERDRRAQIERLNRRIHDEFGVAPTGMWLAERVWEPALPSTLDAAGIRYTFLDDTHFKAAGLSESELTGYFLTEDQGSPLAVYPIDKRLRYTMPFEKPEATFEYLHGLDLKEGERVVVFADDGEKFGIWPETYRTVYDEKWLYNFCELLVANRKWVRTVLPGEVITTRKPAGRLYLPTASYAEMLHWALPSVKAYAGYEKFEHLLKEQDLFDEYNQFVRGGFWRNFLVKYPESNAMQKKMLRVSKRVERVRERMEDGGSKMAKRTSPIENDPRSAGSKSKIENAYSHLLAGQCNCPYWHGVFGGLYLSNVRSAIYRELIEAERELDAIEHIGKGSVTLTDYDIDGADEVIYESGSINAYIAPARGGSILEFDYKPVPYNLCDLLQRRQEGYHLRLVEATAEKPDAEEGKHKKKEKTDDDGEGRHVTGEKNSDDRTHEEVKEKKKGHTGAKSIHDELKVKEAGLEKALRYDSYRHAMLVDHFYGHNVRAKGLREGTLHEQGDFVKGEYTFEGEHRSAGKLTVTLSREGIVHNHPVRVRKEITFDDSSADMDVRYTIESLDGRPIEGRFGIEMAYTLSAGTEPDRYYLFDGTKPEGANALLNSTGEGIGMNYALVDEWLGLKITVDLARRAFLMRAPVETVSLSEQGMERIYQGSMIVAMWELEGARQWEISLRQRIERLR